MRPFSFHTLGWLLLAGHGPLVAQEKITFQDHVLPLVENHCAKCHNPDKKKGDLDLTTFSGVLTGAGSGKVVVAGDPEASKLHRVINHLEDPSMPPSKPKLAEKELEVFKNWIKGGLLETSGSKAIQASKATVDFTLKTPATGKPEGPPPMPPEETLLEPLTVAAQGTAITGLASSPWAPLVAVAGQKQVLLYHSDSLELLAILPFPEGIPAVLTFSLNGRLLLAGGGHAGKSGRVAVWDVTTGERMLTLGEEYDSILAVDLSPDQSRIALGGPGRLVKIYDTKSGELLQKIKKHTDWVVALAFSPNGEYLASADRNGAISVWDPENGQEIHVLAGHKTAVTALHWRSDSRLLGSSGEDGAIKLWEMKEGKQAKTWQAHGPGVLGFAFAQDGRVVSCGRDRLIQVWDGNGSKLKSISLTNEIPVRVTFSHDGARIVGADWLGLVQAWSATDGKPQGRLPSNPPPLADQLAELEKNLGQCPPAAPESEPLKRRIARLKLARSYTPVHFARQSLVQRKLDQAQKQARLDAAQAQVRLNREKLATAQKPEEKAALQKELNQAETDLTRSQAELKSAARALATEQAALDKAMREYQGGKNPLSQR